MSTELLTKDEWETIDTVMCSPLASVVTEQYEDVKAEWIEDELITWKPSTKYKDLYEEGFGDGEEGFKAHIAYLKTLSAELIDEMVAREPLPTNLDFPAWARAEALRHAADWVEAGAPLGKRKALFADLVDAETGEKLALQRCAVGEAMLYLDPDVDHWIAVQPHRALLRRDDPHETCAMLSEAISAFDYEQPEVCATRLREVAALIAPA